MARILTVEKSKSLPPHLFIGPVLAVVFWVASWLHLGVLGEYAFFPQWLGYILTMDALVYLRRGTSLLTRAPSEFLALFILSAPIWWIFEGLNNFVLNWHYLIAAPYSVGQIILISTIDFSTVIPAIFETTAFLSSFSMFEPLRAWRAIAISPRTAWILMYLGAFAFAAVILLPGIAFPLTWVWLVLLVDPLNWLGGRPSLLGRLARGDWRLVVALALAGVMCGFFWEMWNFFAMPKWYYTVPLVGFGKVFEMPILGYLGYIPFAWELYALYQFFWGKLNRPPIALEMDARLF